MAAITLDRPAVSIWRQNLAEAIADAIEAAGPAAVQAFVCRTTVAVATSVDLAVLPACIDFLT